MHKGSYALDQDTSKKIVIQLKLTDSALRAIEVCEENIRVGHSQKPNICFEGNQGNICIPGCDNDETQNFTFQLSSLNQSTSIDCLQQHFSRDSSKFVSLLGDIQQKITVNATDDSYNATKKRFEIAKELEKNISTKVIKQPRSKSGKKQILRRQVLNQNTGRSSFVAGSNPGSSKTLSFTHSVSPMTSRSVSPLPSSDLAGIRNKTKPTLSSLSNTVKPSASSPASLVHEKVLHYLALRPSKLQDLIARLARSGITVDKTSLQNILQQIATVQSVRPGVSEYTLIKTHYNEVQSDWKGYNEDEKAVIKRKLFENVRSSTDVRKRVATGSDTTLAISAKKAIEEETYSNPVKKKARVSLYHRTSPNLTRPRSVSPLETTAPSMGSALLNSSSLLDLNDTDLNKHGLGSGTRKLSPKRPSSANSRPNKLNAPANSNKPVSPLTTSLPPLNDSFSTVTSSKFLLKPKSPENSSPKKVSEKSENSSGNTALKQSLSSKKETSDICASPESKEAFSPETYDQDEFIQQYPPIKFAEQRENYKKDFSDEYKEYLPLHEKVVSQLKRFADWQNDLAKQKRNTDKYKTIARQVYAEYLRLQEDKEFHADRLRRDYLHRKLKHIKRLVLEYDSKQFSRRQMARRDSPKTSSSSRRRANDVAQKRTVLTA